MNEQTNETPEQTAPVATPAPKASKPKAAKAKPVKKAKAKGKAKTKVSADGVKGPQVLRKYAPTYHKDTEHKTAGGHASVDCNDPTAEKLRGKDLDAVYAIAAKTLKEPEADLRKRYKHLNVGMQRMNLGNRIRAATAA